MNSVILSFLYEFVNSACRLVSESRVWNLIGQIYEGFQTAFKHSAVVKAVKHRGKIQLEETSVFCKLLRIPTAILSVLCRIFSRAVKNLADKSITAAYVRGFASGFLSLDVRFFAIMALFAGASGFVANLLFGEFKPLLLVIAAIGFGASFAGKLTLADYIDDSAVVKFIKSSLGFEKISFCVYKPAPPMCVYGSGAIAGIAAGVAATISSMLYLLPVGVFGVITVLTNPLCGIFYAVFLAPLVPTMAVVGVCVLTIFSVLAHKAYTGEYGIKMGRCGLCLMLFLVISALSTLFSFSFIGSVGVLGMYIIFIGFYYIIRDQVRKEETLVGLLKVFAISAAAVSIYGIMQYVFKWDTQNAWIDEEMFEEATMRAYSTLANPNVLGEYLILALPLIALVFINYTKTLWQKTVYGIFFGATLLCLVLTQSRGCWIGFFASAFIFITYYRSALWKILPFFVIFLPFVLPETIINRMLSVGDMSDSSTSYRVYIWMGTLLMLKDFWLGGIGLGEAAFRNVYPFYSYNGIVAPHSHNLYLQIAVESGVVNLLVFVAAMIIFLKDMINVQTKGKRYCMGAAAMLSGVVGFLVQSMFDYTFYNYRVMGIFFMVLALGGAIVTLSSKEETQEQN